MQPDILNPDTGRDGAELKAIFREGWSHEQRVAGWVAGEINAEYADPVCRQAWKEALRAAVAGPLRNAVDIGTGPGTIAQLWAELGCATTGLDFSPGMLETGRHLAEERNLKIRFVEGDAENPALGRSRFDVVSSRFVIFTLPHPGYAMRRWVELLRKGGVLILIGHHRAADTPAKSRKPAAPRRKESGWQVGKGYQQALAALPFMHHTAAELAVVMEATGLREITLHPLGNLLRARAALRERLGCADFPDSTPYLLVGRK